MTLSDLMTQSISRSLCDSWASHIIHTLGPSRRDRRFVPALLDTDSDGGGGLAPNQRSLTNWQRCPVFLRIRWFTCTGDLGEGRRGSWPPSWKKEFLLVGLEKNGDKPVCSDKFDQPKATTFLCEFCHITIVAGCSCSENYIVAQHSAFQTSIIGLRTPRPSHVVPPHKYQPFFT